MYYYIVCITFINYHLSIFKKILILGVYLRNLAQKPSYACTVKCTKRVHYFFNSYLGIQCPLSADREVNSKFVCLHIHSFLYVVQSMSKLTLTYVVVS